VTCDFFIDGQTRKIMENKWKIWKMMENDGNNDGK